MVDFLLGRVTVAQSAGAPALREAEAPTPSTTPADVAIAPMYGLTPTETRVVGLSAVRRALAILAGSLAYIAAQPDGWREWRGNAELPASRIVARPTDVWTRREWTYRIVATLALYDVAHCWLVGGRDSENVPRQVLPLPPTAIIPQGGDAFGILPPPRYVIAGRTIDAEDVLTMRAAVLPTTPDYLAGILNLARDELATALAADWYASRYWQSGGSPVTVLTLKRPFQDDDEAETIANRWRDRRALGPDTPAVLSEDATVAAFGADITGATAVEARRELVADIGRHFGIPTRLMNAPAGDPETYANVQSDNTSLVLFTIGNLASAIDDGITDLLPRGRRMSTDLGVYTRGSLADRAAAWTIATGGQAWMGVDEVREAEDLPPRELPPTPAPATEAVTNGTT